MGHWETRGPQTPLPQWSALKPTLLPLSHCEGCPLGLCIITFSQVPRQESVRLSKSEQTSAGKLRGCTFLGPLSPSPVSSYGGLSSQKGDPHFAWRRPVVTPCHNHSIGWPFIYGVFQASQADQLLRTVYNSSCLELTWPNLRSLMSEPRWSEVQPPETADVGSLWEANAPEPL